MLVLLEMELDPIDDVSVKREQSSLLDGIREDEFMLMVFPPKQRLLSKLRDNP